MTKEKIYVWVSDYSNFTGEGNLAKMFIKYRLQQFYEIKICQLKKDTFFKKKILNYKYLIPFVGILNIWKFHLLKKKTCYLNYLPLWNFFIFLLLPSKTLLGPITGGSKFKNDFSTNYFIRKLLFPILYRLSSKIIIYRKFKTVFATDLLKNNLDNKLIIKSEFNFILSGLKKNKYVKTKKNIDFLIYYRKHKNKLNLYPIKFIKRLLMYNFNIYVIGDQLNIFGVKNLGFVNRIKLNDILSKSKFSILSGENILSLFLVECLNSNVKIISNEKIIKINKNIKKNFVYFNTNKFFKRSEIDFQLKKAYIEK